MKRIALIITIMASSLLLPTVTANASSVSPALVSWVKTFKNGNWSACVFKWNYAKSHENISNGLLLAHTHDYQQYIWNSCGYLSHNSSNATLNQQISSFHSDMLNWVTAVDALNGNYYIKDYKKVNNDFSAIQSTISQILSSPVSSSGSSNYVTTTTKLDCSKGDCPGPRITSVKTSATSVTISWLPPAVAVAKTYEVELATSTEWANVLKLSGAFQIDSGHLSSDTRSFTFAIDNLGGDLPMPGITYHVEVIGWVSDTWGSWSTTTPTVTIPITALQSKTFGQWINSQPQSAEFTTLKNEILTPGNITRDQFIASVMQITSALLISLESFRPGNYAQWDLYTQILHMNQYASSAVGAKSYDNTYNYIAGNATLSDLINWVGGNFAILLKTINSSYNCRISNPAICTASK